MTLERKVLAIPYIRRKGRKTKFLVVHDSASGDWTFISGTCEKGEHPNNCVLRELHEETKGLVTLNKLHKKTKKFRIIYAGKRVDVFFIPLRFSDGDKDMKDISQRFLDISTDIPEFEENSELRFETLAMFLRRKNVWSFVKHIIESEEFHSHCPLGVF